MPGHLQGDWAAGRSHAPFPSVAPSPWDTSWSQRAEPKQSWSPLCMSFRDGAADSTDGPVCIWEGQKARGLSSFPAFSEVMVTREGAGDWPPRGLTSPLPPHPAQRGCPILKSQKPLLPPYFRPLEEEVRVHTGPLLPHGIQTQGRALAGGGEGNWLNNRPHLSRDSSYFQENQPSLRRAPPLPSRHPASGGQEHLDPRRRQNSSVEQGAREELLRK